ncbi:hypothetical protein [Actinophytocola sp.]|uniref:hypothetical protein n=1 Tax=Actinophytocola sp. TaxID=1872138 RepID=UPI003D6A007F
MWEDRRIGSQAPLWRLGSPVLVLRVGWPVLLLAVASVAVVVFGLADPGSGFVIAAWVFGCLGGAMLIGAAIGYVILRRTSAKVGDYAAAEGLDFTVRNRRLTGGWRIAPDCDGGLSRDVITGTVHGRGLVSFLHQSYVDAGRGRALLGGRAPGRVVGVRVTVLDVGRPLPTVELTPRRLPRVENRTLPADDPVAIGMPEIEADYHVATDDPAFAAELLSSAVVAALRSAPQLTVRTSGTRVVVLASPLTTVHGIAAGVRLLDVLSARVDELADTPATPATPPPRSTAYVPPSVRRWRLAPFGDLLVEAGMADVRRGLVRDRPFLTFVRERVIGGDEERQVQREQVIAVALPARLPRLEVWPENTLRQIAPSMAVREDIDIESDDFNRRFQVAAHDRKYAVDVLNPRAVEALLAVADFEWRIDGSDLVGIWDATTADPDAVHTRLHALTTVAELIPAHVVADHGWAAEPADVDTATEGVDHALPPLRAVHVVLATVVGLVVAGAGVPIALAVSDDDRPGAWAGGVVVVVVITVVAVVLTIVFARVADSVRLNKATSSREPTRDGSAPSR